MFVTVREYRCDERHENKRPLPANHVLAIARAMGNPTISRAACLIALAFGVFGGSSASAQTLDGIVVPESDSRNSEFAKLFEQHHERPIPNEPILKMPSLQTNEDVAFGTERNETEASESTWDFYKGLERLSSGAVDYSLFEDGIHARPFIVTDRSRGFNEPIVAPVTGTTNELNKPNKLKPTINLTAQIQADAAFFDQYTNNVQTVGEIPDGAFFRRSRIGVYGELYQTVEYRLEYDFANEARPQILDNWIALTNIPIFNNVIVGHYFEPFSLERYSPNRFVTFMERSLADTFVPARNMGVMVYGNALEKRLTFAVGGFRSGSDAYGDDVSFNSGFAGTAHATYLAWYEEVGQDNLKLLHLGGSYSYRANGDDPVNFSTRPSVRMRQQGVGGVPVFVSTGDLDDASHMQLFGFEAAWVHNAFSIQSEFISADVHRKRNADPFFHGGYVYGSWFLTGESRSYSPTSVLGRFREGIFQRTIPRSNVLDRNAGIGWTGSGAIELAVRWAYIDLNSNGVQGGDLQDMTYGVNWYLNPYTKAMFNYVRPTLRDPTFGTSKANSYALRVQFEF